MARGASQASATEETLRRVRHLVPARYRTCEDTKILLADMQAPGQAATYPDAAIRTIAEGTVIGSDFIKRIETKMVRCSECGKKIMPSEESLVSIKRGKVTKRVCSEECRREFDAAFWESIAYDNQGPSE